jgi:hypothetical protein
MIKRIVLMTFFVSILALTDGLCQQQQKTSQTIVYDPIFWKDKLKLKDWQRIRINEINSDFYGALIEFAKSPVKSTAKENVTKLLDQRSEKIWSTFSQRQKNIWKKLESEYSVSI